MLKTELLDAIKHNFQISNINKIEKIEEGYLNHNYKITTDSNNYFFRHNRITDHEKLISINKVEEFFSSNNIPIVLPLKNQTGEFLIKIEDEYYSLYPFVKGHTIDREDLSLENYKELGEMLSKIHKCSENGVPKINVEVIENKWTKERFLEMATEIEEKITGNTEFDNLARKILELKKDLTSKSTIKFEDIEIKEKFLLHGDYHEKNIFFDEYQKISHVFDLEKTRVGSREFELAYSSMILCFEKDINQDRFERAQAYIKAYHNQFPLKKENMEKAFLLDYQKMINSAWVEKEHYLKNNNRPDKFLKSAFNRINYLANNLEYFIEQLTKDL